jgi:hypothetical protein
MTASEVDLGNDASGLYRSFPMSLFLSLSVIVQTSSRERTSSERPPPQQNMQTT